MHAAMRACMHTQTSLIYSVLRYLSIKVDTYMHYMHSMHTCIHAYTHMYTHICVCLHVCIHAYVCAYGKQVSKYGYLHTSMYTTQTRPDTPHTFITAQNAHRNKKSQHAH